MDSINLARTSSGVGVGSFTSLSLETLVVTNSTRIEPVEQVKLPEFEILNLCDLMPLSSAARTIVSTSADLIERAVSLSSSLNNEEYLFKSVTVIVIVAFSIINSFFG
jgi:hypothetical protein